MKIDITQTIIIFLLTSAWGLIAYYTQSEIDKKTYQAIIKFNEKIKTIEYGLMENVTKNEIAIQENKVTIRHMQDIIGK